MTEFVRFEDLDSEDAFVAIVTTHFKEAWAEITGAFSAVPMVSEARVRLAFSLYQSNLQKIRLLVQSQDPDHYKRSACLLNALVQAQVIEDVEYDKARLEEMESGLAFGLSFADCQYEIDGMKMFEFYGNNGNEGMSFDLAFRCCQTYENSEREYGPHFFETVIHHLCDGDGSIRGFYLILKAFWDPS